MKTSLAFSAAASYALVALVSFSAAQNTTTTTTNTTSQIPTDISQTCQTFLATLNSDTELSSCTQPLLEATKYYSSTNSSTASAQLDATLTNLCGGTSGCDQNLIRTRLDQFWQNCHTDLQAKNAQLQAYYDNLYMITPLVNSICSQDSTGSYCLKTIAKAAASNSSTQVSRRRSLEYQLEERDVVDDDETELVEEEAELAQRQLLGKRQSSTTESNLDGLESQTNVTAAGTTNAAFLFISSTSPKTILCSECSSKILASYIKFETSIPYGIGLRTSTILAPQSDIYKAAKSTCGADFVKQINVIAGTTQFAEVTNSATKALTKTTATSLAVVVAALTIAFTL